MNPTFDPLTWHIMDGTADDWETIDLILPHVKKFLGSQDRATIENKIRELFQNGYFEVMPIDGKITAKLNTDIRNHWFGMTKLGRSLWDADRTYYRNEENT